MKKQFSFIENVRGIGLMLGCELNRDTGDRIVELCLERGLIINCIQGRILRFVPPLTIKRTEINEALKILQQVFARVESEI